VQIGLISIVGTSNKALVAQHKDKYRNPKKQHPLHNNKQNKGHKPSQLTSTPNGDKEAKSKNKKTNKHCNFCGKYGHVESKCLKKMEALEVTMKKHNISINYSFLTLVLMDMHFLLLVSTSMQLLLLLLMSNLLILENLIIWLRIKPYFLL
jgi:hypothetical protein